jgi:hypothetical protein
MHDLEMSTPKGQKHTIFEGAELLALFAENGTCGIESEGNEEDNELLAGEWDPQIRTHRNYSPAMSLVVTSATGRYRHCIQI